MAQQTINIGTSPNDGTGDPLRTAMQKTNSNFTECYTKDAAQDTRLTTNEGNITSLQNAVNNAQGRITNVSATGNYNTSWFGSVVNVDATGAAVTITLPTTSLTTGQVIQVRKSDAGTNSVTLTPFTGFATLNTQGEYIEAMWNGTSWVPLSWNDLPYNSNLDLRVATLENTPANPYVFNDQTASYALTAGDAFAFVTLTSATGVTLTIPTDSTATIATGTKIVIEQGGAGQVTIAGAGGVTVDSKGGLLNINGQYAVVTLVKKGTNHWLAYGDLA